jgi:hypothetical protein
MVPDILTGIFMRYIYLRLFLTSVDLPPLLVTSGHLAQKLSRTKFISKIFSERWDFEHYGTTMVYLPIPPEDVNGDIFCFGRVGKLVTDHVNDGPEAMFAPASRQSWRAANVAVDTRDFDDGQKVAMQVRTDVGKPLAVLNSLVQHINAEHPDSGWLISVNSVAKVASFWQAIEDNKGAITRAEFTYVTPNVLGIRSKLNQRLKEYRENENAKEVSVTLTDPKGNLKLESQEVKDSVEYISEGGGSARLKVGRQVVFDSKDTDKAEDVQSDDVLEMHDKEGRLSYISRFFMK